jgi:hypothetical protein
MTVLIPKGTRNAIRSTTGPMVFGVELNDAREELFVVMVCDGLSLGVAFNRAGFTSKDHSAPSKLFHLPRVQERARAIFEARRTTGVVSLGEVTSMLQRVFAGAHSEGEYSAAHNAAFSLARLYGHVTDRATLEVIRRPSRDPDAPSEQALGDWVAGLPAINGPGPEGPQGLLAPLRGAPAAPLGPEPAGPEPSMHVDVHRNQSEFSNEINGLEEFRTLTGIGTGEAPGRSENGAPARPVTGTPNQRGPADLLGPGPPNQRGPADLLGPGPQQKGAPVQPLQVPGYPEGVEWPDAKELF